MNTAPIKRTLTVTGILMTGAACGMGAVKVLSPQWLAPASESATVAAEDQSPAGQTASARLGTVEQEAVSSR